MLAELDAVENVSVSGRVRSAVGLSIRAALPGLRLGDVVRIERREHGDLLAEVVGFSEDEARLLPYDTPLGVGPDDVVHPTGGVLGVPCSDALLGRVLDGLGQPLDGGSAIAGEPRPVVAAPPNPMTRPRIDAPLVTGVRALDGLLTIGRGQRVGLFAGSGVGKSTLLGQIARQSDADVFVICLIGERGREVVEFLEDSLGEEGRRRAVVVVATSDTPALLRLKSAYVATAIAEHFRDEGKSVVLLMDSVTRFARAGREVGLAAGEPPARRGYPPSVFAALPSLLERSGQSPRGSITAFYTVLVEGGDMEEPIADEVRGILDGHVILERELGMRGRWPAIDVLQSLSRVMDLVVDADHVAAARALREDLAAYESKLDLVNLGAYKPGSDPKLDRALAKIDAIESFLRQGKHERSDLDATAAHLRTLAR